MIVIHFPDEASERAALGWLAGRFSFRIWLPRRMMLPAEAPPHLEREGIRFEVEGRATYEQLAPLFLRPGPRF
jgi:hypothetical protein